MLALWETTFSAPREPALRGTFSAPWDQVSLDFEKISDPGSLGSEELGPCVNMLAGSEGKTRVVLA